MKTVTIFAVSILFILLLPACGSDLSGSSSAGDIYNIPDTSGTPPDVSIAQNSPKPTEPFHTETPAPSNETEAPDGVNEEMLEAVESAFWDGAFGEDAAEYSLVSLETADSEAWAYVRTRSASGSSGFIVQLVLSEDEWYTADITEVHAEVSTEYFFEEYGVTVLFPQEWDGLFEFVENEPAVSFQNGDKVETYTRARRSVSLYCVPRPRDEALSGFIAEISAADAADKERIMASGDFQHGACEVLYDGDEAFVYIAFSNDAPYSVETPAERLSAHSYQTVYDSLMFGDGCKVISGK